MTFMTMPKKLQKDHRADPAHAVASTRNKKSADIERAVTESAERNAAVRTVDAEENCPVIRANHIVFSSGRMGRTRVVFY